MADNNSTAASGGVSIFGLLGTVFLVLKLCHVITWPWLWVLAPFWGPVAAFLAVLAVIGLIMAAVWIVGRLTR